MKFLRLILGGAVLVASPFLAEALSRSLGSETVWGPVTTVAAVCFLAGMIFCSGLRGD